MIVVQVLFPSFLSFFKLVLSYYNFKKLISYSCPVYVILYFLVPFPDALIHITYKFPFTELKTLYRNRIINLNYKQVM